ARRTSPTRSSGTYTANRRPLCRPYRTWLGCCSPDRQAAQFACPHRLRRKPREPSIAGHGPAASFSIQPMTSADDSVVARIISDVCHATHQNDKQNLQRKKRWKSRLQRTICAFVLVLLSHKGTGAGI